MKSKKEKVETKLLFFRNQNSYKDVRMEIQENNEQQQMHKRSVLLSVVHWCTEGLVQLHYAIPKIKHFTTVSQGSLLVRVLDS